jgi:cobalamin biosynthesis protein CobT
MCSLVLSDSGQNCKCIKLANSPVRRMSSSGMLCRVALVRTNVSGEHIASIFRLTRIGELGMLTLISD